MTRHVNEKEYKNKINIFSGDTLLVNTQESVLTVWINPITRTKENYSNGRILKYCGTVRRIHI